MMSYCSNGTGCYYKTDTGQCGYTGYGCIKEMLTKVNTVEVLDKPKYSITQLVDLSDESIEKIADAIVKKLLQTKGEAHERTD